MGTTSEGTNRTKRSLSCRKESCKILIRSTEDVHLDITARSRLGLHDKDNKQIEEEYRQ